MSCYLQGDSKEIKRANTLMIMDDIAYKFNDTDYTDYWMMYGVPNGATTQDFIDIANDTDEFNRITDLFVRILKHVKDDGGLYNATPHEYSYARQLCPDIQNYYETEV